MKNVVLNNDINLTIPEGFVEVSGAEVQEMGVCKGPAPMWSMTNKEEHMLITASWMKFGWLTSRMINAKDMAKAIRNKYNSKLKVKSMFGCTYGDIFETSLDGHKAYAFPCIYRAFTKDGELVDMVHDTMVVKIGDMFYVFQAFYRDALKDRSLSTVHEVYESVQFAAAA